MFALTEKIESVLGHIELLSDEAIAELQSQFKEKKKNYQQLETEKFELNKQQQWFEQKYKIDSEISQKQQHHRTQLNAQQALASNRLLLAQLETFAA